MEAENEKEVWERLTAVEQSTKSAHHKIEKRPTKRYETVVTAIITALVGGLIGYFIKMLGF